MQISWPAPNRKFSNLDSLGIVGIVGLLVGRFIPVAKWIPFWGCAFRQYTGIPCPGCGLTRVADRFAHLNFFGAFKANPLGTLGAAVFAVLAVWMVLHLVFKVPQPQVQLNDRDWKVLRNVVIAAVVVNYAFVIAQHKLAIL